MTGWPAGRIDGTEDKDVVPPVAARESRYQGLQLLLGHSMPIVYFHSMTACNIVRRNGLAMGKRNMTSGT